MSEVLWMIHVSLLWCGMLYFLVRRYDEQILALALKYGGEYVHYLADVRRWLPRLVCPSGTTRFPSSPWQILRAELSVVFIITAPLVNEFIVAPCLE